jgi:hypothetical protein
MASYGARVRRLGFCLAAAFAFAQPVFAEGFRTFTIGKISGKTGEPDTTIELSRNGGVRWSGPEGATGAAQLAPGDLADARRVLGEAALLAAALVCDAPRGADLDILKMTLRTDAETVAFTSQCHIPPALYALSRKLEAMRRAHIPGMR